MSLSRIIIKISKTDISLFYVPDSEEAMPLLLPDAVWPMPLRKFGGAKAESPTFAIGKGVDERLESFSVPGSSHPNVFGEYPKAELPILVIAENDIADSGIENICANLERWGYNKVKVTRPDVVVTDFYNREAEHENLVIASSNGTDLTVSVFLKNGTPRLERRNFDGRAVDNRVDGLAMKIWEQVKDNTFDLSVDTELAALRRESEAFLKENRYEKNGEIRLSDGDYYQYIISRKTLDELPATEESVEDLFTAYLQDNGLADRSNTALILRNDAIGSHYLRGALVKSFPTVANEEGSIQDMIYRFIANRDWEKISGSIDPTLVKESKTQIEKDPMPGKVMIDPEPEESTEDDIKEFIPVEIHANIEKVKTGLFYKKSVLKITIDLPLGVALPWDSVLCVQEEPLLMIDPRKIVKEYEKGRKGPFALKLDLPLAQCPKAKKLRIYFKPHPDEPIGINNAYEQDPVTVEV